MLLKRLLVGLMVACIAIAGYWGLTRYQRYSFIESISAPIKNTSLRVANVATYETNDDSKITLKEMFDKLESDIGEIDRRILEVQTIASPSRESVTDSAVEYMRGCQGLLRALLAKHRNSLYPNTPSEWAQSAADVVSSAKSLIDVVARFSAADILPRDALIDPAILHAVARRNAR